LEKILTNKRVLADVEKLSSKYQTSTLKAFHSVILRFTQFPKSKKRSVFGESSKNTTDTLSCKKIFIDV
jgi:hypothetical protein